MTLWWLLAACANHGDADPCADLQPGDRLDLDAVCVDGHCAPILPADAEAAFGPPSACTTADRELTCVYAGGITVVYPDGDEDGVADDPAEVDWFWQELAVQAPYDGRSEDGLGPGVPLGCFGAVYGASTPDGEVLTWSLPGPSTEDTTLRVTPDGDLAGEVRMRWAWSE